MPHREKLLFESSIHTATQSRVQPFSQLSVVSLTPQLSVINCLFRVSHRYMLHSQACHLHSASQPHTHTTAGGHASTYTCQTCTSWTDISLTSVILKGQPVRRNRHSLLLALPTVPFLLSLFSFSVTHHRLSAFWSEFSVSVSPPQRHTAA